MSKKKLIRKPRRATGAARTAVRMSRSASELPLTPPPTQDQPSMQNQEPIEMVEIEQQPQPENLSTINGETANSEAVEEIEAPSFAPEPVATEQIQNALAQPVVAAVMDQSSFRVFLGSLFQATGYGMGLAYPPPWQSITQAPSVPEFVPASDALYRLAQRHTWLRFLIEEDAQWIADIAIIATFGGKVGFGVYSEFQQRKHPRQTASETATKAESAS